MRLTSRHSPLDQTKGTEFIFALDRPSQPVVNCSNTCSMARSGAATMSDELNLAITGVEPQNEIAGARRVWLATTRGKIPMMLHAVERAERAVLCLGEPAAAWTDRRCSIRGWAWKCARWADRAAAGLPDSRRDDGKRARYHGGTVVSQGYRPSARGPVGHSFGGAVAIAAATMSPMAVAVVAISSQLDGAQNVNQLAPRPLLLIHGTADTVLPTKALG